MGPIIGRSLVDYGGRNVYATVQLAMCILGTRTVYKTVALIWSWNQAHLGKDFEARPPSSTLFTLLLAWLLLF